MNKQSSLRDLIAEIPVILRLCGNLRQPTLPEPAQKLASLHTDTLLSKIAQATADYTYVAPASYKDNGQVVPSGGYKINYNPELPHYRVPVSVTTGTPLDPSMYGHLYPQDTQTPTTPAQPKAPTPPANKQIAKAPSSGATFFGIPVP